MSIPPANIPEQPWTYPPALHPGGRHPAAPVGGFYARGGAPAVPQGPNPDSAIWAGAQRSDTGKRVALLTVAALGALLVVFFAMLESGLAGTFIGAIVALIPLGAVLATVRWLDRWEPEPRPYLVIAFSWGAGVAAAGSMYFNTRIFTLIAAATGDQAAAELLSVGFVAPVVEEILKGGFVLALLLWRGRLINSSVDLVVYAATVASGFAFTENILYFARGLSQGILGPVFFGRAIMSPFAHIMFTTATALLLAAVLFHKRSHLWWAFPVGLAIAMGLHAAWNLSASLAGGQFFTIFLYFHVPIFLAFVAGVVLLRRRERRAIISNLREYERAGWFAGHEIEMLGSLSQRSQARTWANQFGVRAGMEMAEFQRAATSLGLHRHQMVQVARKNPIALPNLVDEEKHLLQEVQTRRGNFRAIGGAQAKVIVEPQ